MKIIQNNGDALHIVDKPWRLSVFFIIVAIFMLYLTMKNFEDLTRGQSIGLGVNILFLFFIIYAVRKKAYIYFDNHTKSVNWYREEIYAKNSGTFKFEDIDDIVRKEMGGTDGRSYRVEVKLKNGESIPLVMYYSSLEKNETIRKTIVEWLKRSD